MRNSTHLFLLLATLSLVSCVGTKGLTGQQRKIISAARWQIGKTTSYNPAYKKLQYPNGDIPINQGVCTDVVVRALRKGLRIDLQKEIHEDMSSDFNAYPSLWSLTAPDYHIDHRRVPNMRTYFRRKGWELPLSDLKTNCQPGDLITCTIRRGSPHIMIVSDRKCQSGNWCLIHNGGIGVSEIDALFNEEVTGPLTGHYRISREESGGK